MAFSLQAVFGIDATGVKTELKQLRRELNSFVDDYAKLGAGLAVGAFVALSKGALDLASSLKTSALNIGINVEKLQALHFAAQQNGESMENMDKALEKLRLNVQGAAEGNKQYVDALAKLHLTAAQLIGLPLEQKYEAIARAYRASTDKAEAYNAVSDLFGEKIGPKQIAVLDSLAKDGFAKVAREASAAGQVMTAETIVALEKASQAIDDFKKRAVVAVGNIIVNFRTEDGMKLLLYQFLRVVGVFGAKIVDAVVEGGQLIWAVFKGAFIGVGNVLYNALISAFAAAATQLNKVLPDKLQINIKGIEDLKVAGNGIGDEISRAIADTKPSTFAKDVGDFWDKTIADQQAVVNQLNHTDLGPAAQKLKDAGKTLQVGGQVAGKAIEDGAKKAAEAFRSAVLSLQQATKAIFDQATKQLFLLGAMSGSSMSQLSDEALKEIVRQDTNKQQSLRKGSAFDTGDDLQIARLVQEALNASTELDVRNRFRSSIALNGVEGARQNYDPVIFEKLLAQFGPGSSDWQSRQTNLLTQIRDSLRGTITTAQRPNPTG